MGWGGRWARAPRASSAASASAATASAGLAWLLRGQFGRQLVPYHAKHRDGFQSILRRAIRAARPFVNRVERFGPVDLSDSLSSAPTTAAAASGRQQRIEAKLKKRRVLRLKINVRRQPTVAGV